jgi:hypothetical protein
MINKSILGLTVAAIFVSGAAFAKPVKPVTTDFSLPGSALATSGSFSQSFDLVALASSNNSITVGSLTSVFGSGSSLSFSFDGGATTTAVQNGLNFSSTYTVTTPLIVGSHYTLLVSGVSTVANAQYTVSGVGFSATSTPAVPEPETYALLLAGLGLVGTIARRRRVNQA